MQDGEFRACCCSKIVVKLHCKFVLYVGYRRIHQVLLRAQQDYQVVKRRRETDAVLTKTPDQKKKDNKGTTGNRLRDFPEWLQEFTDNLEDTEVPASAYISHDSDSERLTKVASRKHGIHTHFPQDRNCEICQRTKITRAPCRRRTGEAVPRAEKFGDLITAEHKVLNEGGESRNNHQYAVVVQDLSHSMESILPVQDKNFSGDGKAFTRVSRAVGKVESHLYRQFT